MQPLKAVKDNTVLFWVYLCVLPFSWHRASSQTKGQTLSAGSWLDSSARYRICCPGSHTAACSCSSSNNHHTENSCQKSIKVPLVGYIICTKRYSCFTTTDNSRGNGKNGFLISVFRNIFSSIFTARSFDKVTTQNAIVLTLPAKPFCLCCPTHVRAMLNFYLCSLTFFCAVYRSCMCWSRRTRTPRGTAHRNRPGPLICSWGAVAAGPTGCKEPSVKFKLVSRPLKIIRYLSHFCFYFMDLSNLGGIVGQHSISGGERQSQIL